jgi:C-terminal processing protease CtpA/Prc
MKFQNRALALILTLALPLAGFAAERGYFGFSMAIDVDGFLNPTLNSITIAKVAPSSPAALAGIKTGDEVLEVEGHAVAGAKAKEIQALAEKDVGQSLTLKVKHAKGDAVTVTLVSTARPAS